MAQFFNPSLLEKDVHFGTKVTHVGQSPDQWAFKDVVPPISLSTTFKQSSPSVHAGFEYGRSGNPSRNVLETCLASLDNAKHSLTFASGLAATSAVIQLLEPGSHVICGNDMYGGTNRYFSKIASKMGVTITKTDLALNKDINSLILPETKMIWIESPTNPCMTVIDIKNISLLAHLVDPNIKVVVDNTFQTPYFQTPLDLCADIVLYSLSKYMNGHSDVVMGSVAMNDDKLFEELKFIQNACGYIPSPFDCYLVNRGLKTLHVRMNEHQKNGFAVAQFLKDHPLVEKVMHPGLKSHPQHDVAIRQCSGFSGMLSFYIKGGLQEATAFLKALNVFCLAESLGGFESLAEHPASMTHASVPLEERETLNISDNLIRLSVGIESIVDLIADLAQAFRMSTGDHTKLI